MHLRGTARAVRPPALGVMQAGRRRRRPSSWCGSWRAGEAWPPRARSRRVGSGIECGPLGRQRRGGWRRRGAHAWHVGRRRRGARQPEAIGLPPGRVGAASELKSWQPGRAEGNRERGAGGGCEGRAIQIATCRETEGRESDTQSPRGTESVRERQRYTKSDRGIHRGAARQIHRGHRGIPRRPRESTDSR